MSRAPWAAVALLALTACSDGYQGDGEPLRLHHDMTQQEALAAMGRVGRGVRDGASAFELLEHCVLAWQAGKQRHTTPLQGTEAALIKPPEGDHYRVVLTVAVGAEDAPGTVRLDHAPWTEATQMKWLLDYVRRLC